MSKKGKAANCEDCMNYEYDEEYECYTCAQNLGKRKIASTLTFLGGCFAATDI